MELANPPPAGLLVDLTDGSSCAGQAEGARPSASTDVLPTREADDAAPHGRDAAAQLETQFSLMTAMLAQLERLRQSVSFEERRVEDNPLLPILRAVLNSLDDEMAAHGIEPLAPLLGVALDPNEHEVQRRGSAKARAPRPDEANFVVDACVREGKRHRETGRVLRRATVVLAPPARGGDVGCRAAGAGDAVACSSGPGHACGGESAAPASATPAQAQPTTTAEDDSGAAAAVTAAAVATVAGCAAADAVAEEPDEAPPRVHVLARSDTLQGLAVRYGVRPTAILKANKLPSAQAMHARATLVIPPPPSQRPRPPRPAAAAAASAAAADAASAADDEPRPAVLSRGSSGGSGFTRAAPPAPSARDMLQAQLTAFYGKWVAAPAPDGGMELTPASPGPEPCGDEDDEDANGGLLDGILRRRRSSRSRLIQEGDG